MPKEKSVKKSATQTTTKSADEVALETPRVFPRYLPPSSRKEISLRALQISKVLAVHFAKLGFRSMRHQEIPSGAYAEPLRKSFEDLGSTFMKFGQLIASSPGVFGEDVAAEFRDCLDTGKPEDLATVRHIIEAELGMSISDAFATFDDEPIGRASIAVVHKATLHDGSEVAVKILRPDIERRVSTDMDLFEPMLQIIARQTGELGAGQLLQMFEGFRSQLAEELDLRNERRAMEHYAELLKLVDLPLVTVPKTYPQFSGARVLTMEFLDGVPIDDLANAEAFGVDPRPVVQQEVQGFLMTAIRWGMFHADVHAGNLLLLRDGRIGVIDWGIVGRLDEETQEYFRKFVEAALGDDEAWAYLGEFTTRMYGPAVESLGMSVDDMTQFMKVSLTPLLTAPFGEVDLADLMTAPQKKIAEMKGFEAEKMTLLTILKRWREQRKLRALMEDHGTYNSDFDRGIFLLSKQLMYFERYGRMFMADISIFEDEAFFRTCLAAPRGNAAITAGKAS